MGGSQSHEFMVASTRARIRRQCKAADMPRISKRRSPCPSAPACRIPKAISTPEEFHTPGQKTIAEFPRSPACPATSQMKSLVMVADGKPVLGAGARRSSAERDEVRGCAGRGDPSCSPRRDARMVRRRRRLARSGRRKEHAASSRILRSRAGAT